MIYFTLRQATNILHTLSVYEFLMRVPYKMEEANREELSYTRWLLPNKNAEITKWLYR